MITLVRDPLGLAEATVIIACLAFDVWWFLPAQRAKRRREHARNRAQLRRAFADITRPAALPARRNQEDQK